MRALEWEQFSPGEAAELTGVSYDQQRNLKRRYQVLPLQKGWVRFTLREICDVAVFGFAARVGIDPAVILNHAGAIADCLMAHVLASPDAWKGGESEYSDYGYKVGASLRGVNYFVWYQINEGEFIKDTASIDDLMGLHGAVVTVFFDIRRAAAQIRARAPRPFVAVSRPGLARA